MEDEVYFLGEYPNNSKQKRCQYFEAKSMFAVHIQNNLICQW